MTLEKQVTEKLVPNPEGDGAWYWYRKNKNEKWHPVYVNSKTEHWPPCINDIHSTSVEQLVGEWHSEIKYPI